MTEEELQRALERALPAERRHDLLVEESRDQDIRLRFSLAPGETWSSAALLSLVDTALRAAAGLSCTLSHLTVTLLGPAQEADVIALSRVIGSDGRAVHCEAWLFSHAVVDPLLHATATLRRPPAPPGD